MKFQIHCVSPEIKEMYESHKMYHKGDSGLDLFITEDIIIKANETTLVDLGIKCQLPSTNRFSLNTHYYSYLMFPRSSVSKTPLRLANSIGLIDSEYKGNLKAAFHNTSNEDFKLKKGERFVQLVRPDLGPIRFEVVDSLRTTNRNSGFGSTGR